MRVFLTSLPFHAIDYIVVALLFYGLIGGVIRGLAGEVARAIAFLALLATLYHAHPPATRVLEETTNLAPEDAPWVAFAVLMVAALGVYAVGRALAKRFFKGAFRGLNQRLGGAVAGLLRGAVLAALLLLAAGLTPIESLQRAVVEDSWFGQRAHAALPDAYRRIAERYALPPYPAPPAPDKAEPDAPARDNPSDRVDNRPGAQTLAQHPETLYLSASGHAKGKDHVTAHRREARFGLSVRVPPLVGAPALGLLQSHADTEHILAGV